MHCHVIGLFVGGSASLAQCASAAVCQPGPFHAHTVFMYAIGVSAEALSLADATAYIPMAGFVTSFNVSVAASLIFYEAHRARMQQLGFHGNLTPEEKDILTAVMLLRHQVHCQLRCAVCAGHAVCGS